MTALGTRIANALGRPQPEGERGIAAVGHRGYVGGMWDEIGTLQFGFMKAQGLQPHHVLLDIACGSLRGGVHFIPYLDRGNYLGIEKEAGLVRLGLDQELDPSVRSAKAPEFVISDSFEFVRFSRRPGFALAQSLFTHLRRVTSWIACVNFGLSRLAAACSRRSSWAASRRSTRPSAMTTCGSAIRRMNWRVSPPRAAGGCVTSVTGSTRAGR